MKAMIEMDMANSDEGYLKHSNELGIWILERLPQMVNVASLGRYHYR